MISRRARAGDDVRSGAARLAGDLPPLLVAAHRVAATVRAGTHGRRRGGPGETFWQYRQFASGDPASAVDWRRSGRADQLYVREREWETAQTVVLWCDCSASMDYRSHLSLPGKRDRAWLMTLALAVLLARGGERVGLVGARPLAAGARETLFRLALDLETRDLGRVADLAAAARPPEAAQVVLVGDFLDPIPDLEAALRHLAGRPGYLLGVRDPAEDRLPFRGRGRVEGPEGEGGRLIGRLDSLRDAFGREAAAQRAAVGDLARAYGWALGWHQTDSPPEPALLALYRFLADQPC